MRCLNGADADPLGVLALLGDLDVLALFMILLLTIGLSVRVGIYRRRWSVGDSESGDGPWLVDACARSFLLVFLSLLGLLALGLMYGNVLGAANANP